VRKNLDLNELKEQIIVKGIFNPLTVTSFKDTNGVEKYKQRRFIYFSERLK
jgi:hypothetical protein